MKTDSKVIERKLAAAAALYYAPKAGKESPMTDAEYDAEKERLAKIAPKSKFLSQIGTDMGVNKVKIPVPMGSLEKFRPAELPIWLSKVQMQAKAKGSQVGSVLVTPKLDGVSLEILYKDGHLERGYSRGDGEYGLDVTPHAKKIWGTTGIRSHKTRIKKRDTVSERNALRASPMMSFTGTVIVKGEVVCALPMFKKLQALMKSRGLTPYKNARNFVAGMMNSKVPQEEYLGYMHFVAFSIEPLKSKSLSTYFADKGMDTKLSRLMLLRDIGFATSLNASRGMSFNDEIQNLKLWKKAFVAKYAADQEPLISKAKDFSKSREHYINTDHYTVLNAKDFSGVKGKVALDSTNRWFKNAQAIGILTDGLVIEVNDIDTQKALGTETNSHNPKWARAIKPDREQQIMKVGTVKEVVLTISKRGILKPVAVLKTPLDFGGVAVSKMTMHNAGYVRDEAVTAGAKLSVIRSGDVIPYILSVDSVKGKKAAFPKVCPHCKTSLKWSDTDLYCPKATCEGRTLANVKGFFSIVEVDGLSDGIIDVLNDAGYTTIKSVLTLTRAKLLKIDGFATKRATALANGLAECCQDIPFATLAHASGIFATEVTGLGSRKLSAIEAGIGLDRILTDKNFDGLRKDVLALDGFALGTAKLFVKALPAFRAFLASLATEDLVSFTRPKKAASSKLKGKVFVFTGFRDADTERLIEKHGGKVGSSVSKTTTLLFFKDGSTSGKISAATKLGVKSISQSKAKAKVLALIKGN